MAHVEACRLLPTRLDLLDALPKGCVCAEVGVAFGDFSAEILARTNPARLHLVDAWSEGRYAKGAQLIATKFEVGIKSGRVVVNRGLSTERLPEFADGYFDWLYIDTNHTYETTFQELKIASQKVNLGGLIAGHDFSVGNAVRPVIYGVIEACAQFCVENGWRYKYLTLETDGSFSFCLERMSG